MTFGIGARIDNIAANRQDSAQYWQTLQNEESTKNYAYELASFVTGTLRTVMGHKSKYTTVSTDHAKTCAVELHSNLASGKAIFEGIHNLLLALLDSESDEEAKTMWDNPLTCWLAARSLKDDGRFLEPNDFTVVLAKFKYIIRAFAVIEAHYRMTADNLTAIKYVLIVKTQPFNVSQF